MAIENWFAFRPGDSVSAQRFAFYYRDGNNQRVAEVTGGTARTLACYVLCRLALVRGYTILSCTADFDAMRDYMNDDMYRSHMLEVIDLILDSVLATPAMMIGTEAGGWGSNVCDVTVGDYSSSDSTCAFAIRTRNNDFERIGNSYSVDLIAACAVLNALSPRRSFLMGKTTGTGDYVFPLLTYTPGHYQHSDGKADWIVRAGKIGYKYHSVSNYGGGYDVFADALAPLVWELRSNPLAVSALRAIERVYYLAQQLSSEISTSTSNIHSYINDATDAVDPSTIARASDVGLLATSAQADAIAQAVSACATPSDLTDLVREGVDGHKVVRLSDLEGLAKCNDIDALVADISNCAHKSDISDLAKQGDLERLATSDQVQDLPRMADLLRLESKVDGLKPGAISSAVAFSAGAIGLIADLKSLASSGPAQATHASGDSGGSQQRAADRAPLPGGETARDGASWTTEDEI